MLNIISMSFAIIGLTPEWAQKLPETRDFIYIMGEATSSDKDEALNKAWNSALIRMAMSEFPELTQVSAKSTETLKSSEFERSTVQNFQLINWKGIREVKFMGSPFTNFDLKTNTFTVYRLLVWTKAGIEAARKEANESLAKVKLQNGSTVPTYEVPTAPESQQIKEKQISESLSKLQKINNVIQSRDQSVAAVMDKLICGNKISDITKVLGRPDRMGQKNNGSFVFYWGNYEVIPSDDEGHIHYITPQLGRDISKVLCGNY